MVCQFPCHRTLHPAFRKPDDRGQSSGGYGPVARQRQNCSAEIQIRCLKSFPEGRNLNGPRSRSLTSNGDDFRDPERASPEFGPTLAGPQDPLGPLRIDASMRQRSSTQGSIISHDLLRTASLSDAMYSRPSSRILVSSSRTILSRTSPSKDTRINTHLSETSSMLLAFAHLPFTRPVQSLDTTPLCQPLDQHAWWAGDLTMLGAIGKPSIVLR